MESITETKAVTLVQFLQGLRGELHVTLEERGGITPSDQDPQGVTTSAASSLFQK
jgi:hypothetical protein